MKINNSEKGFTLIEILVVVAIIGILIVVAMPLLYENINKARISSFEEHFQTVESAASKYYSDNDRVALSLKELEGYMEDLGKSPLGGTYKLRAKTKANGYRILNTRGERINAYKVKPNSEVDESKMEPLDKHGDVFFSVQGTTENKIYLSKKQFKKLVDEMGYENIYTSSRPYASEYQFTELYIRVTNDILPDPK